MKFVFTLVSLLAVLASFANPADSVRAEQRDEGLFIIHEVEDDETLYSIAKRYGGSVLNIIKHNQIVDNRIEIGQTLSVLVEKDAPVQANTSIMKHQSVTGIHLVEAGETLYSISKKYDLKLKELRKWNGLTNNDISPGMLLKVDEAARIDKTDIKDSIDIATVNNVEPDSTIQVEADPFEGFEDYLVQTGETLSTIASKIGVRIDSLKLWNGLDSDYLKIGQQLFFRINENVESEEINRPKEKQRTQIDENGFERIYEEGVASVIQSIKSTKYLALHRSLPIGTNLEVRNLMNNQIVHVKVIGKLPNTGLNKNILLRLSQSAYDQLGILDSKSRVEVSYNKE